MGFHRKKLDHSRPFKWLCGLNKTQGVALGGGGEGTQTKFTEVKLGAGPDQTPASEAADKLHHLPLQKAARPAPQTGEMLPQPCQYLRTQDS